jgi:aerobactin synthase
MNYWDIANTQLIAKALRELVFEQILKPLSMGSNQFAVSLKSGPTYHFEAISGVWGDLRVNSKSLTRTPVATNLSAAQFFIDIQEELEIDDILLANFLEEMHNTLYSDTRLLEKNQTLHARDIINMNSDKIQSLLNGHPKLILNKGRMNWGIDDLERYSPESAQPIQLHWVALKREKAVCFDKSNEHLHDLLTECCDDSELAKLKESLSEKTDTPRAYLLVPVHPWQWNNKIAQQFAGDIARSTMISLGSFGDYYLAQTSLRTLSNISRRKNPDIKLPLSILNTSAVRGLSPKYALIGPAISKALDEICDSDPLLQEYKTLPLLEIGGIFRHHEYFSQVKDAPYRYHEFFGALWRQSPNALMQDNEMALLTGALTHVDYHGKSLIGALIAQSGLSTEAWLSQYFRHIVIPLYHLQALYGIGLVAHGQNIVLRLKDSVPVGMFIKDFQGDLRIATTHADQYFGEMKQLSKLPPEYLIHDLITGHFVTVLRFVSGILADCDHFPESKFYSILASEVAKYLKTRKVPDDLNLLAPTFHRVLVNKVRFKVGYADSAERPVPILGDDLINPLNRFYAKQENSYEERI